MVWRLINTFAGNFFLRAESVWVQNLRISKRSLGECIIICCAEACNLKNEQLFRTQGSLRWADSGFASMHITALKSTRQYCASTSILSRSRECRWLESCPTMFNPSFVIMCAVFRCRTAVHQRAPQYSIKFKYLFMRVYMYKDLNWSLLVCSGVQEADKYFKRFAMRSLPTKIRCKQRIHNISQGLQ